MIRFIFEIKLKYLHKARQDTDVGGQEGHEVLIQEEGLAAVAAAGAVLPLPAAAAEAEGSHLVEDQPVGEPAPVPQERLQRHRLGLAPRVGAGVLATMLEEHVLLHHVLATGDDDLKEDVQYPCAI